MEALEPDSVRKRLHSMPVLPYLERMILPYMKDAASMVEVLPPDEGLVMLHLCNNFVPSIEDGAQ